MNFDIVRKIKTSQFKASFSDLRLRDQFSLIIFLLGLLVTLIPQHVTYAQPVGLQAGSGPVLVFDSGTTDHDDYLAALGQELTDQYYQQQAQLHAIRLQKLTAQVRTYLEQRNSPLAEYAHVLVTLRNWKKITALANAESTLCRRYPTHLANCWGVGGADLWDMGDNLGEGVVSMNHFLNNYPRRSVVKYSQMSFEHMNGFYKQPAAQHWVDNNYAVYDDLVEIEKNVE